jgi:EmrB/QacA subfamily drug resistance transporter
VKARLFAPENRKWWTLAAVAFGLFMIMLDNTVVNVALPSIQRSLHLKISELEWVVAGYALTFGALMLTGGKLADLFGRRLAFVVGLAIFTGSSLACGLAGSATLLIGARVVQGVGAALMNPATLSIITVTFPPRQRGTAIGIWAGVSALALAIGPLVGGLIAQRINWNWIFFINIPVGLLAIAAAYAFIDESRDTSREQKPDVSGLFTSALGLFALSYALIESNNYGWTSGRILGAFAVAAVALTTFILVELHQRLPMLELGLFRNRVFAGANTVMLLVGLAMFGVFFYVSLYLQQVLDYSPTQAGASFLPMTALIVVLAPIAGKLSDRIGPRPLVTTGLVLLSGSLLFFGRMDIHTTFWGLLPAMLLGGVGMATAMAPVTAAAMGSVRPDKAGVGSAVLNSMRQVGGSLGIALMGAIVANGVSSSLRSGHPQPVAFVNGFHHALDVAAAIAVVGAVIAVSTLRKVHHPEHPPAESSAFAEAAR